MKQGRITTAIRNLDIAETIVSEINRHPAPRSMLPTLEEQERWPERFVARVKKHERRNEKAHRK